MSTALKNITDFHQSSSRYDWDVEATSMIPADPRTVALPPPEWPEAKLSDCLTQRLSCRNFASHVPMSLAKLSMLLASGYGLRGHVHAMGQNMEERPVPSASALYQLQLLVFARDVADLPPAIYRYNSAEKTISALAGLPDHTDMSQLYLGQNYVADAAAIILLTCNPAFR